MLELQCVVQTYAWGKRGLESSVAQLKAAADKSFRVDPSVPYAELWMGTHPNGPSRVLRAGEPAELLSECVQRDPALLGEPQGESSPKDLPYLFKVLSVQTALSIQAHPDLSLARELHARAPELYRDANHKPEMTIALTPFEALCQFRPLEEIVDHLQAVPELAALVGEPAARQLAATPTREALRELFRSLIHADKAAVATQLAALRARLEARRAAGAEALSSLEALALRLHEQYADDVGCFCPFLLNYVTLAPGEAIFLGANEPHAYLSGDCIECMAGSDNVVRAGLTPKFVDKDTLTRMLTYRAGRPAVTAGKRIDDATRIYTPPVPEFEVEAVALGPRQARALSVRRGASILLVVAGEGSASVSAAAGEGATGVALARGRVFFLAAGEQVALEAAGDGLEVFRASPNEGVAGA